MEDHADDDADDDNVQYDGTAIQSTATVRQLAVAKRNDICAQLAWLNYQTAPAYVSPSVIKILSSHFIDV